MSRLGRALIMALCAMAAIAGKAQADTTTVHVIRRGCDAVLTLERVRSLEQRVVEVTERDGTKASYRGAWLGEVLDFGCDSTAWLDKHGSLRAVVKVTAADGFVAVVAMAEALKDFSDHPVMLAWQRNGEPLSERHGPFQLVLADDRKPGRNVRQVKVLEVILP